MLLKTITFHPLLPLLRWVKSIPTWKTVIESMQTLGMDNLRVAYTRFLAFYSDNPSGLSDGESPAKWPSKATFATHPLTETEWPPKRLTHSVAKGWNYTMICRRVCKCEPLLRFNPLNLAKMACFAKWVKGAKCVLLPGWIPLAKIGPNEAKYLLKAWAIPMASVKVLPSTVNLFGKDNLLR